MLISSPLGVHRHVDHRAGMFTANTMAAFNEAIGMSLPGSASAPAMSRKSGGAFLSDKLSWSQHYQDRLV